MWFLKSLFKKRDEQLVGDGDVVKPFLDHLEDLRWTLIKMVATLATTMMAAFGFRKQLAKLLSYPLEAALHRPIADVVIITGPVDAITVSFTLAFYTGLVVSFPLLFYFLAQFLLPALTRKEKKYVLPAVGVGFGLFLTGVMLCFFYVLPPTLKWLFTDASDFGKPSWTIREYYGFVTHLCIAVGLVCELPVVMVTLSFIGLISYAWLKGMRMYGYAIALVLAGIISPTPDLFMLFIFALPIMALFELCIWIVFFLEKRRAKDEQVEARKEQPISPAPVPYPHEDPQHGYHDEHHDPHHGHDDFHDEHGNYRDPHDTGDEHRAGEGESGGEKKDAPEKKDDPEKPQT